MIKLKEIIKLKIHHLNQNKIIKWVFYQKQAKISP